MNEKDKELIKSLASLFNKLKKLFHFDTIFCLPHASVEEDSEKTQASDPSHDRINIVNTALTNDATGENAIGSILKNENLSNQDN